MTAGVSGDDDTDDGPEDGTEPPPAGTQRIDKWLWFTRVVKSRSLASRLVADGKVRVNRGKIDKPSTAVRPGDVVTIAVNRDVKVLRVLLPGGRRGPATEAQTLYEDLTPMPDLPAKSDTTGATAAGSGEFRERGQGRPTKRDRRATDRLKS